MGVIKKNEPRLGKYSSESEESLHIVQVSEDDASSQSDIIVVTPSSNHTRRRLFPIPMSISSGRKNLGKKRFRRFENGHHLETLVEDEELQAVTIYDFIPNTCTGFSIILENICAEEIWESFISSSDDAQHQIVCNRIPAKSVPFLPSQTPDEAFRNIKTGIRKVLKKSQVPLGMIEHLETELVEFFTSTPADIFISEHLSSFQRLLLHAVAQYYCLRSLSFDSEPDNIRLVRISNPFKNFHRPSMLLFEFLMERRRRSTVQTS